MQQYDQRRLRLFAVVLFLGIMAANLGRYLIFDGLYLWDARLRWQECAYEFGCGCGGKYPSASDSVD